MLPLVTGDLRRQSCARPSWSTTVRGVIWLKVHTSSVLQRSGWVAEQVGDVDSDWQLDPPAIKKKKKAYVKAYLDALYQEMGTLFSIELKTDWLQYNYSTAVLQYNFVFYAHTTQDDSPPPIFFKSTLLS